MSKHKIELYKAKDGNRLRIKSPNGEIILVNGQGIANKVDLAEMLVNFLDAVKGNEYTVNHFNLEENMKDLELIRLLLKNPDVTFATKNEICNVLYETNEIDNATYKELLAIFAGNPPNELP